MATIKDDAKILEILTSLSKQRGFVFKVVKYMEDLDQLGTMVH